MARLAQAEPSTLAASMALAEKPAESMLKVFDAKTTALLLGIPCSSRPSTENMVQEIFWRCLENAAVVTAVYGRPIFFIVTSCTSLLKQAFARPQERGTFFLRYVVFSRMHKGFSCFVYFPFSSGIVLLFA